MPRPATRRNRDLSPSEITIVKRARKAPSPAVVSPFDQIVYMMRMLSELRDRFSILTGELIEPKLTPENRGDEVLNYRVKSNLDYVLGLFSEVLRDRVSIDTVDRHDRRPYAVDFVRPTSQRANSKGR